MTQNQIAYWNLQETKRSNLINEDIKNRTLAETARSNMVREGLQSEAQAETHRSNLVNEGLHAQSNAETIRSNQAKEAETSRHNMAVEAETLRNNLATLNEKELQRLTNHIISNNELVYKYDALQDKTFVDTSKLSFDVLKEINRVVNPLYGLIK